MSSLGASAMPADGQVDEVAVSGFEDLVGHLGGQAHGFAVAGEHDAHAAVRPPLPGVWFWLCR